MPPVVALRQAVGEEIYCIIQLHNKQVLSARLVMDCASGIIACISKIIICDRSSHIYVEEELLSSLEV